MGLIRIKFISGYDTGKVIDFNQEQIIIGRSAECDIRIDQPLVSRRHARIFIKDGKHYVEDLNSRNGAKVNNKAIKLSRLRDEDFFIIGETTFQFLMVEFNERNQTFVGENTILRTVSPSDSTVHRPSAPPPPTPSPAEPSREKKDPVKKQTASPPNRPLWFKAALLIAILLLGLLLLVALARFRSNRQSKDGGQNDSCNALITPDYSIAQFKGTRELNEAVERLYREGLSKWEDKALDDGNLYIAFHKWDESLYYLSKVDGEPPFAKEMRDLHDQAKEEINDQYHRLRFERVRAEKTGNRAMLASILQQIMALHPDEKNERNRCAKRDIEILRASNH